LGPRRAPEPLECDKVGNSTYNIPMDIGPAASDARGAYAAAQAGRHDQAVELYRRAVSAAPGSASLRYDLGLELAAVGRRSEALEAFHESARLDPGSPDGLNEIGRLEIEAGRLGAAKSALDEALRRNPEYPPAQNNRGVVEFLQGRFAEAADRFRRALRADPDNADAWYNLADACDELGDQAGRDEARARYRKLSE